MASEKSLENFKSEITDGVQEIVTQQGYVPPDNVEQTLAIIKPDAIDKADEIISVLHREGFSVLQARRVKLSEDQAASFYQDQYKEDWFQGCIENVSSGHLLALVLSGPGAVRHLYKLVGPASWEERSQRPKCLRFQYGTENDDHKNAIHASANSEDALRELHFFFPELIVEPTIVSGLAAQYLNNSVHPTLTIGLAKLVRERPEDPVIWLADWLLANNPNKPKESGAKKHAGKCK